MQIQKSNQQELCPLLCSGNQANQNWNPPIGEGGVAILKFLTLIWIQFLKIQNSKM